MCAKFTEHNIANHLPIQRDSDGWPITNLYGENMIPIDMNETKTSFLEKRINAWEFEFLTDIRAEEKLTEAQWNTLAKIAEKALPRHVILPKEQDSFDFLNSCKQKVDPYFQDTYFKDEY